MSPQKSPAFSFYAKDFLTGTSTMSLQEVGAYVRLLAYQWDAGSVPEDANERARVLGCAKSQERDIWKKVGRKFVLADTGYLNERLEEERFKQNERSVRLSNNGKLGGRPKKADTKQTETNGFPIAKADENLNKRLPSSSSFSEEQKTTHSARERVNGHGNGANAPGSLPRDHRFHAVCGGRMRVCLSEKTAADLAASWGGAPDDAVAKLRQFCDELEAEIGDGPKGDHLWLLAQFDAFKVREGRVPVAVTAASSKAKDAGVAAAIDKWGTDD